RSPGLASSPCPTDPRPPAPGVRAPPPPGEEIPLAVLGESICPYCGVGCRLRFEGAGADVTRVRGVETAAANRGGMCAKGAQLGPTIHTADRLARPLLRLRRQDDFHPTDWDTALRHVAERFASILHSHGPAAVAFYGSRQPA